MKCLLTVAAGSIVVDRTKLLEQTVCNILTRMISDAKQFVFAIPQFTCRVLQKTCSCCTSRYNLRSSLEPQAIWQSKVRVSDHRTCDRCSRRHWPCCCSSDILTCAPLGFSLGVPSPLLGDGLYLETRSSELLRSLEILVRHLKQARTSLAALAPAIRPVENCCGRTGRHPVFPCNLPSVPVRR